MDSINLSGRWINRFESAHSACHQLAATRLLFWLDKWIGGFRDPDRFTHFFFFKKNDTVIAGKKEDMKERKWDEIGNESGKEGRKKETTLTEQNSSSTLSVEPGTFLSLHLWFVMLLPCCHWVPFFIFQIGNGEEKLCDFFISYHLDLTECRCGINARGMLDNWIYNTLSQKFFYYWYSLGRNYMHCFEGGWHQVLCYL